jgi:dihydroneopterin aldolase
LGLIIISNIELFDFELNVVIGTYKDDEITPDKHILDLTLSTEPSHVIIENNNMDDLFGWDILIKGINTLVRESHYKTQEMLITLIA